VQAPKNELPEVVKRVLTDFDTIAVVGLSTDPAKAAHAVPAALQSSGYRIIPVHLSADKILGERAYPSLLAVPDRIEIVQLFRPAQEAPRFARQAVEIGAKAIWLQLGLRSPQAKRISEQAGLVYIEDRCMSIDRTRLGITKSRSR
jgi:uncharacterized protein